MNKAQQGIINEGKKAAESFLIADVSASKTKRQVIMAMAKRHAGDVAQTKLVLQGYQEGFIANGQTESTAKVRKAEANAVFKALAHTEVSENNEAKLNETESIGYNDWIALARKLAGNAERSSSSKERKAPAEMTTSQYDKVEQNLAKASVTQLNAVAEQAVKDIHKKAPAPLAGYNTLLLLQAAAVSLTKNDQLDEFFSKVGEQVLAILEPAIQQVKDAQAKSTEVEQAAKNGVQVQTEQEPAPATN